MATGEKKKSHLGLRIAIVLVIAAALGISLIWETKINITLGFGSKEVAGVARESIDLDVHFVDVGQGDACILELPDDRVMLIDSGEKDSDDKLIAYIDEHIRRDGKKLDYFDIAMVTHSDSDHCGEMADVLKQYPAKNFYRPNVAADRDGYVDPGIAAGDLYGDYCAKSTVAYMTAIEAGYAGVEQLGGEAYATNALDEAQNVIKPADIAPGQPGYYTLTLYTPTVDTYKTGSSDPDWNNYSPIMILEYEGKRMALSGDAEKEAEAEFVELVERGEGKFSIFNDSFYVNLIKLGHHGSRTSSSQGYLDAITAPGSCAATFAVISCGKDNKYKHPHTETLERLSAMGFDGNNILRTDEIGTIVATVKLNEQFVYDLFIGGATAGEVAMFAWRWLYIAGIILAVAVVLLLVLPAFFAHGGRIEVGGGKKGGARKRSGGNRGGRR